MQIRPRLWWEEISNSLWFVPAVITLLAVVLAALTLTVDGWLASPSGSDLSWTFGGGVDGARGVLSAIASSLVTVTGVVFSVTVVALQLASSQFSPRVLRNFMGDAANQVVLGVFIGTFTYALLVLRSVRSAADNGTTFVPSLSVTVAIALALLSVGFLIYFIDHTAHSIRASDIVDRTIKQALDVMERVFPADAGARAGDVASFVVPSGDLATVTAPSAGYVQGVDMAALDKQAQRHGLFIAVVPRFGDYMLPGSILANVWPVTVVDDETEKAVRSAVALGRERSAGEDLEFAIARLADIAAKALSPGINDPTTARICIDRLAEIVVVLGNRAMPAVLYQRNGHTAQVARPNTTYDRCVAAAFDDIRHFGHSIPSLAVHLLQRLGQVYALLPSERGLPIIRQGRLLLQAAQAAEQNSTNRAALDEAGKWLRNMDSNLPGEEMWRAAV